MRKAKKITMILAVLCILTMGFAAHASAFDADYGVFMFIPGHPVWSDMLSLTYDGALIFDSSYGSGSYIVLGSSRHLLSLINDILDLSKVEAGKFVIEPTEIHTETLLANSLIMFNEKTLKHGIQLSLNGGHLPDTIIADERKLKQVLYNLLSNAVKFTPDGGEIRLSARLVDCVVRSGLRWGDAEDLQIIEEAAAFAK